MVGAINVIFIYLWIDAVVVIEKYDLTICILFIICFLLCYRPISKLIILSRLVVIYPYKLCQFLGENDCIF